MSGRGLILAIVAAVVGLVAARILIPKAVANVEQVLFWVFAGVTCGAAIAVAVSQNVVRMALWLIVSLGSVAGLFFMLHADFVGATQLMIYVGGTLVVLVFGVMLTATGPWQKIRTTPGEGFLAAGIGALLLMLLLSTVVAVPWDKLNDEQQLASTQGFNPESQGNTARPLGLSFLGLRPDKDLDTALTPVALEGTTVAVAEPRLETIEDEEDEEDEIVEIVETVHSLPVAQLKAGHQYRFDFTYASSSRPAAGQLTVGLTGHGADAESADWSRQIQAKARSLKVPQTGKFYVTLPRPVPDDLQLVARIENRLSGKNSPHLIPKADGDDSADPPELTIENLSIHEVGDLSTGYLLPFEIVSVHLLVVLIGAAYLARAKRRADSTQPGSSHE